MNAPFGGSLARSLTSFARGTYRTVTDCSSIAYVFSTAGQTIDYVLGEMILPQLEADCHGVDVARMVFLHDDAFVLREGDPPGSSTSPRRTTPS